MKTDRLPIIVCNYDAGVTVLADSEKNRTGLHTPETAEEIKLALDHEGCWSGSDGDNHKYEYDGVYLEDVELPEGSIYLPPGSATLRTIQAIFWQWRDREDDDANDGEEALDRIQELLDSLEKDGLHFGDDYMGSDGDPRPIAPYSRPEEQQDQEQPYWTEDGRWPRMDWDRAVEMYGADKAELALAEWQKRGELPSQNDATDGKAALKTPSADLDLASLQMPQVRLEHLRGELRAERISYLELAELTALAVEGHIPEDDVELLEAAGVPEAEEEREAWFAERRAEAPEQPEGQQGHTPEPWSWDGPYVSRYSDDATLGYFGGNADGIVAQDIIPFAEANARRAAICVNICAGMEAETLDALEFSILTYVIGAIRNLRAIATNWERGDLAAAVRDGAEFATEMAHAFALESPVDPDVPAEGKETADDSPS